jgi:hypothetical protein
MFPSVKSVLLLAMMVASAICEDSPVARVFLHKYVTTAPIQVVEDRDFEVVYHIINGGDAAAFSIEVQDRYDPKRCENENKLY